jgi:hypothetical protein
MNFINDKELALRFKNDAVPSRERFIYAALYLLPFYFITSSFFLYIRDDDVAIGWPTIVDFGIVTINIIGMFICYRTNKHGDDSEFIERYISISVPIWFKYFVVMNLCIVAFAFLNQIYLPQFDFGMGVEEFGNVDLFVNLVQLPYFIASFIRLNSSIWLASH